MKIPFLARMAKLKRFKKSSLKDIKVKMNNKINVRRVTTKRWYNFKKSKFLKLLRKYLKA